jgi:hypothetical protein
MHLMFNLLTLQQLSDFGMALKTNPQDTLNPLAYVGRE